MKRSGSPRSRREWLRAITLIALGVSIICGNGEVSAQEPPDLACPHCRKPSAGEGHVRPDETAGAVPFESVGQGDSFNAAGTLGRPTILIFGNKGEAAHFTELLNDKTHAKRIEDVDFTRHWVVVVVRGIRPSGGYGIQIRGVNRASGTVRLRVKLANPAPRRFVTQALTYPYHVIKVQRSKLSIPAGTKWAAHTLSGELLAQTIYPQQPPALEGANVKIR